MPPIDNPGLSGDRTWARVRRYLHQNRGLDPGLIERCRHIGILGADHRANAVFTCRDRDRRKTGAELVGTRPDRPFRAMAPESRKAAGGFWIARQAAPKTALLVEGAIDALSAWTLDEGKRIDIVISTAGATGRMPEWIDRFLLETVSADMTPTRPETWPPQCSRRKTPRSGACVQAVTVTSRTGMTF